MMEGIDLLERLVSIPSPTGEEDEAVAFMQRQARADGFRVIADPVGNFVAEAGHGSRLLLFVGHIDTVPGEVPVRRENGTLWGRGTVDAKGPLVAAYVAARRHLKDPALRIRIVGAVDEEGHSRGARAVPDDLGPDWILIGEPSGAHGLTLGYKGILRGVFRLTRERGHGAHRGASAAEQAFEFWETLRVRHRFDERFDTLQGRLDAVNTTTDGLIDHVEAQFNIRLPPGIDPAAVEADLLRSAESQGIHLELDERMPGAMASKRTPLVAAFLATVRGRGGKPVLKRKTGTADLTIFHARHPEVPIAAYGPGDAALDHTPNERIEVAEFEEAVEVLDEVFTRFAVASRLENPPSHIPSRKRNA
jgi:LysW-gamma-L-lysine carboxypeptidase